MRLATGKEIVLVIPDLQIPYEHPDALPFVREVARVLKPTKVVCIGDEADQYAVSGFDTDPDADGPGAELKKTIARLKPWYKAFPEVSVCMSNHIARIYKKAFHAGVSKAYLRPVNEWLNAPPGWKWADSFEIDGVNYEHGDAQGGMYAARNLCIARRQSTVIGHHHGHGAVFYIANRREMLFGMNVGCLIDFNSLAFQYAKGSKYLPTLGCGAVIYGVPYFVPMLTNPKGRWTGELIL